MNLPVGRKRERTYRGRMADRAQLASARDIPQTQALVITTGGEGLAVGRERDGKYDIGVAGQYPKFFSARDIPQPHTLVARRRRQQFSIG